MARRPAGALEDLSDGQLQRRRIIARARERRIRERPHHRTGIAGQWLDEAGRPGAHHRRLRAARQADHQVGYGVLRPQELSAGTGVDNHADAQRRRRKRIHADRFRPPVLPQPEGLRVQRPARAGNRDDHTDVRWVDRDRANHSNPEAGVRLVEGSAAAGVAVAEAATAMASTVTHSSRPRTRRPCCAPETA